MKRIRVSPPSPALAIACLALFVSLGGVSYGLATGSIGTREIRDNSIRSKDIRNNSVYSRDLRNNDVRSIDIRNGTIVGRDVARNTLTGEHVNMARLGQVPDSAALAGRPASDYARAASPLRLVGDAAVPFAAGVSAAGGDLLAPGFWIDGDGVVALQGTVSGPPAPGALFTLPEGHRPAAAAAFRVPAGGGATTVTVDAGGLVVADGPGASLDGIAFRAAP